MKELQEYQKRVVQEHLDLDDKIRKLRAFMDSEQAMLIPKIDHCDLLNQLDAMNDYLSILADRIARF